MCSDYIKNKETIYRYAKIIFRNRIKYLCFVFASQFFISPFKCRVWFYFFHVLSCFKNKTVDIFFCIFWISLIFYLSSAFPSPICCEHTASLSQHVWSFSSSKKVLKFRSWSKQYSSDLNSYPISEHGQYVITWSIDIHWYVFIILQYSPMKGFQYSTQIPASHHVHLCSLGN